jgi:hypothetical protein
MSQRIKVLAYLSLSLKARVTRQTLAFDLPDDGGRPADSGLD